MYTLKLTNLTEEEKERIEKAIGEKLFSEKQTERNPNAESVSENPLLSDVCHWDDEWCNDDKDDCDAREYETGCKHNFYFNDGDVFSNEFKYCPFCGKQIEVTVRSCDIDYDLD